MNETQEAANAEHKCRMCEAKHPEEKWALCCASCKRWGCTKCVTDVQDGKTWTGEYWLSHWMLTCDDCAPWFAGLQDHVIKLDSKKQAAM